MVAPPCTRPQPIHGRMKGRPYKHSPFDNARRCSQLMLTSGCIHGECAHQRMFNQVHFAASFSTMARLACKGVEVSPMLMLPSADDFMSSDHITLQPIELFPQALSWFAPSICLASRVKRWAGDRLLATHNCLLAIYISLPCEGEWTLKWMAHYEIWKYCQSTSRMQA